MIQKAIDILKVRKSDAIKVIVIVIFFHILESMIKLLLNIFGLADVAFVKFLSLPVFLFLTFVPMILFLGFQRSVVFCSRSQRTLSEFFRIGYKYFWRVLVFLILLVILCFILSILVSMVLGMIEGSEPAAGFYFRIAFPLTFLLLIKYFYFVPAQIIVYNRSISQSVSNMKSYRIREIKQFILLCLAIHVSLLITSNMISFFLVRNYLM